MDLGEAFVASLVEFYSVDEIKAAWIQAFEAAAARSRTTIHISSRSKEGSASAGIALATPAEFAAFINACREAIRQLGGDTATPVNQLGTGVDFSRVPTQA